MERCKDCKWIDDVLVKGGDKYCFRKTDFGDANNCKNYKRKWYKFWRPK